MYGPEKESTKHQSTSKTRDEQSEVSVEVLLYCILFHFDMSKLYKYTAISCLMNAHVVSCIHVPCFNLYEY